MGVQVETITPGDGEKRRLVPMFGSIRSLVEVLSSCFQGRRSRRRASTSRCTMSVSGEAAPLGGTTTPGADNPNY